MPLLTPLKERRRLSVENPNVSLVSAVDALWETMGGVQTTAGAAISETSALSISSVWACVRILSDTVASLPLMLYRRLDRGKERAAGHPLYRLLHDRPNPEMSSFTFRETLQGHLCLWGNIYAEIERDAMNRVIALWPLRPDRTWPERVDGRRIFKTRLGSGEQIVLRADRVLHIPGFGFDGTVGRSVVGFARETLGLAKATEQYGAAYFGNGARPAVVLKHPGVLSDPARKNLRKSWEEMHQGLNNAHRTAILEEGVTAEKIGIPPEDSQFLGTRQFQVQEVARIFRIPLHMLADNTMSPASNVEQSAIDFVTHTIRPWLVRWEQGLNWDVVSDGSVFAEFLVDGLLRGDMAARSTYYREQFAIGALSQNDIREMENRNPIEGGDEYYIPLNMAPVGAAAQAEPQTEPQTEPPADAARLLVLDAVRRCLSREVNAVRRARKKGPEGFGAWIDGDFYRRHESYVAEQLAPVLAAVRYGGGEDGLLAGEQAADRVAARWVRASTAVLAEARQTEDPATALDACLADWEAGRATALTDDILGEGALRRAA